MKPWNTLEHREYGQHCTSVFTSHCVYGSWGPMMQQSYNCLQNCIRVLCVRMFFVVYCSPALCVWAFLWDLIGQLVHEDSANSKPHKFSLGASCISVKMAFLLSVPYTAIQTHFEPNTQGGDAICRNVHIRSVYKSSFRRDRNDHYRLAQMSNQFPSESTSMKIKSAHIDGSK